MEASTTAAGTARLPQRNRGMEDGPTVARTHGITTAGDKMATEARVIGVNKMEVAAPLLQRNHGIVAGDKMEAQTTGAKTEATAAGDKSTMEDRITVARGTVGETIITAVGADGVNHQ